MLDQGQVAVLGVAGPVTDEATPSPAWLEAAEAFHACAPKVGVVGTDALLVLVAVSVATVGVVAAPVAVVGFLAGAWGTHLYRRRMAVEAQGLGWYLRLLPGPLLVTLGAVAATDTQSSARSVLAVAAAAAVILVSRLAAWIVVVRARRRELGLRPAIAVGTAERLRQLQRRVDGFPESGVRVAATVTEDAANEMEGLRAASLLQRGAIDQVLIVDTSAQGLLEKWSAAQGDAAGDVDCALVLPPGSGLRATAGHIGDLGVIPLGRLAPKRRRMWSKRFFDVVVAGLLLILLAPVFAIAALAIWVYDRGPVFYRQWRVGLDGRQFRIWKFRSMRPGADSLTADLARANVASGLLFKVADDPRVTPVGSLLRRLAIDELPQFFNVVTGDMSLVGPRPLPVAPDEFNGSARRRHHVRPGITGLWQVAGGHVVDYEDMIRLDLAYIDGWSLRQDIGLLLMTVPAVLVRRSAY